jgi:dTMP kinase
MTAFSKTLNRGAFITFEGPEGCGKSTQVERLAEKLKAEGISVLCTREPGGTRTGEQIRDILKEHGTTGEKLVPEAELFLFLASRAQLVRQVILPALESGTWVISDRYIDSTVAYQGYGRNFGPDRIMAFNSFVVGPATPDLTLLLDLDVKVGFARLDARYKDQDAKHDRMELLDAAFHERMRNGYLDLARRMPDRIRVIQADAPRDTVLDAIWEAVCHALGSTGPSRV